MQQSGRQRLATGTWIVQYNLKFDCLSPEGLVGWSRLLLKRLIHLPEHCKERDDFAYVSLNHRQRCGKSIPGGVDELYELKGFLWDERGNWEESY